MGKFGWSRHTAVLATTLLLLSSAAPQALAAPGRITRVAAAGDFQGNCYAFRSEEWHMAERIANLQSYWWNILQQDYNGNYPPASPPDDSRYILAFHHMAQIRLWVGDDSIVSGMVYDQISIEERYGLITDKVTVYDHGGPFSWAAQVISSAQFALDDASAAEMKRPGTGMEDYHRSQSKLSNSWDALKQLPCGREAPNPSVPPVPSAGLLAATFTVQAWVSPPSMPFDARPTLYARTAPRSTCSASVRYYNTNRPPRSFNGYAQTVPNNGLISWSWHEMTRGSGGTATIMRTVRNIRVTSKASFAVTH